MLETYKSFCLLRHTKFSIQIIKMKNILILCTGNSCRSQIAHAYLENFTDKKNVKVYSAGIETHGVNPNAMATLAEDGIDIGHYTSNN
jgi:arsenate reductase